MKFHKGHFGFFRLSERRFTHTYSGYLEPTCWQVVAAASLELSIANCPRELSVSEKKVTAPREFPLVGIYGNDERRSGLHRAKLGTLNSLPLRRGVLLPCFGLAM